MFYRFNLNLKTYIILIYKPTKALKCVLYYTDNHKNTACNKKATLQIKSHHSFSTSLSK